MRKIVLLLMLTVGCAHVSRYDQARLGLVGHSTDDLIRFAGSPDHKESLSDGSEVWQYTYCGSSIHTNADGRVYGSSGCGKHLYGIKNGVVTSWNRAQ